MKLSLLLVLSTLSLSSLALPTPPVAPSTAVPAKRYIIKLKPSFPQSRLHSFLGSFTPSVASLTPANVIKYSYDPSIFNGIAGTFTQDFLDTFRKEHPGAIDYVEEDGKVHALGTQASPPSWGLTRVSEKKLDLAQPFLYPDSAGAGVDVYIIDTGVQANQTDFDGRAQMAKSFVATEEATDMNGHGTHVAGTIGSRTYGIAKKVNIFGVKVLDADGSGEFSDVVAGIQFVTQQVRAGKTVINMSLGGPKSQSVDDAAVAAVKAGVVVIVAAGNDYGGDACQSSPSGAAGVLAVGATDNTDKMADFSNIGTCVGIFAPGVDITSLWMGANGATNKISGTSMATPHVVGVAALMMGQKQYPTVASVVSALKSASTTGVITGLDTASPNALLYEDGMLTA